MSAVDFQCPSCGILFFDLFLFTKHLRGHERRGNITVACFQCDKTFNDVKKWRRHISIHIGAQFVRDAEQGGNTSADNWDKVDDTEVQGGSSNTEGDDDPQNVTMQDEHNGACVQDNLMSAADQQVECDEREVSRDCDKQALDFVMDLHMKGLSGKHCTEVLKSVGNFCKSAVNDYKNMLRDGEQSIDLEDLPTLRSFSNLLSPANRDKCMRLGHFLVKPVTVSLPNGGNAQYVPVLEQLAYVVGKREVYSHLLHRDESGTGYRSFHDGSEHQGRHGQINISIYFDEFSLTNPLGNKVAKQKMGAFYLSLPDIPSGQLKHIFLAVLVRSKYFKSESLDSILKPLLDDLTKLGNEGIQIEVDGEKKTCTGTVRFVIGDNLGQHFVGRYNECFSGGNRLCRFCHVSSVQMGVVLSEKECRMRTQEEHDAEIQALMESESPEKLHQLFGLKGQSPFSRLPEFSIIGRQPPDIAHDIFEGVAPLVIKWVLTALVRERRVVNMEELNGLIASFPYSHLDRNHPQTMTMKADGIAVKQTACECRCLIRLLPLVIGSRVPVLCEEWDAFLGLKEIVEYVCAPQLTNQQLVYLESFVEEWLASLSRVFPGQFKMTPKFHYIIHYASQIRQHGPLKYLWTLRFENKHQELKRLAKSSRNTRNLARTVALGHQRNLSRQLTSKNFVHCPAELIIEDATKVKRTLSGCQDIRSCRINGVWHHVGEIVILGRDSFEGFCLVEAIGPGGKFDVEEMRIRHFSASLQAYVVQRSGVRKEVMNTQLLDTNPLACYDVGEEGMAVPLLHKLAGLD